MKQRLLHHLQKKIFWLLIISVVLNIFFEYQIWRRIENSKISPKDTPANYPLLSPRIFAENQNDILINFLPLRNTLRTVSTEYGDTFGLYFEYLPSGTSIGINEKTEYFSASLIKVPVVMAYFRQKEESGLNIDQTTVQIQENEIDKEYGTLWKRGAGAKIEFQEAVKLALTESDNTALLVIANNVQQQYFEDVYQGLDIDYQEKDQRVMITPKQYSSILKALYLSSVLSKESSQAILTMMTKTNFSDKLVAGIPKDILVAHKTGVYEKGQIYQDCGIVYVPKRPYILCMVSRSNEFTARERMKYISEQVYRFIVDANRDGK